MSQHLVFHRKVRRVTKKSDEFERITQVILNNLHQHLGYDRVEGSRNHIGQLSGIPRQIDATVYQTDGKMILVECKLHCRPVDIEYLEAFYYVIYRDVGA